MTVTTSASERCPTHVTGSPPPATDPFVAEPQPSICKGCGAQVGTAAARRTHYCTCCGTALSHCISGEGATCPNCGPIDRNGRFVVPVDYMAELLAGRLAPSDDEQAAAIVRIRLGDQVAHYVHLDYLRGSFYRGALARGRTKIPLRVHLEQRRIEAAAPCAAAPCRGLAWTPVATANDLLHLHLRGPGSNSVCDRCGA
jgi:hypothetical protein